MLTKRLSVNKKKHYGLLLAVSLFFIYTAIANAQNSKSRQYIVKIGQKAPDFSMTLPSGEVVRLSALRGKVVMLQFTASWCGVCRKEMPHIEAQIWQKHKDNPDFALFGIDRDEPKATVEKYTKEVGITYPVGLDPKGGIFEKFAEKDAGITRNVIIDKKGRIVMLTRLYDPDEFEKMVSLIDKLLNEK